MDLTSILQDSNWGTEANSLNGNFQKVKQELERLAMLTIPVIGYYQTGQELIAEYPVPKVGDKAWVGTVFPGKVYKCVTAGDWQATNYAPGSSEDNASGLENIFIQLSVMAANAKASADSASDAVSLKANTDLGNVSLDKLLSANGYYKAPDGLMIQWGTGLYTSSSVTFSFLISFLTIYSIYFSPSAKTSPDSSVWGFRPISVTASGFRIRASWSSGGSSGDLSSESFTWMAIGRWK